MRAIVNTGPGRLEMLDLPVPEPGIGQVRIRTSACGICATELAMIAGWKRTGFPSIPGHEWSGVADAVGPGVDGSLVGRKCVAENVLSDGLEVGFEHPGGYAEYLITEARNVQPLPDDFPMHEAALIEPLAVAVRGLRRLLPELAEPVLIFGDGPIGLLMLMLCVHHGRKASIVGGSAYKLSLAMEIGASAALDFHSAGADLAATIESALGTEFTTIIEASGSVRAMESALDLVARCGRILALSDYGEDTRADFRWLHLIHREIDLIGSNASAGAWPEAVRLATEAHLSLGHLITHRFPASDFAQAFDAIRTSRDQTVKVVLEWGP